MPRVEFTPWDRVYILKVICTLQMTFASFVAILYTYLIVLQIWTSSEDERIDIIWYKYFVIILSSLDFGAGTLLAFAANMEGIRCRRRIVLWIVFEIILIPLSIYILMRLYYNIINSKETLVTDPHYTRINIVQVCFFICHFFFIGYAIDFLVTRKSKKKIYDPSIRPHSVYAPTYPKITTTESRHIRLSQSFLFQPSTSKGVHKNMEGEEKEEKSSEGQ